MTTQPETPEVAPLPARPALRLAAVPAEYDVDFDAFVRTYEGRLRRLVMRRIGDLCEAEEITQETLLRAYQHRASFASEDELMAWSTVVAQRLVIDRVRVRGRSVAVADVPETARLGRDTAEIVVARHEARAALESLEAIPGRQAAILWAREVEGLHYEEIADRFGITEPAVRSLLHRGRKALRKEFKERTGSLPLNGLVPFAPWLVALKAAGKLRGVARTFAKSSTTTVAALSISALVATGYVAIHGGGMPLPPDARINATTGDATLVEYTGSAAAADPAARTETYAARWGSGSRRADDGGKDGRRVDACSPVTTTRNFCGVHYYDGPETDFPGATFQIGPDLPDNPTGQKNIKVTTNKVDCASTSMVPSTGLVTCTQSGPPPQSPMRPLPTPSHAPEGALR